MNTSFPLSVRSLSRFGSDLDDESKKRIRKKQMAAGVMAGNGALGWTAMGAIGGGVIAENNSNASTQQKETAIVQQPAPIISNTFLKGAMDGALWTGGIAFTLAAIFVLLIGQRERRNAHKKLNV